MGNIITQTVRGDLIKGDLIVLNSTLLQLDGVSVIAIINENNGMYNCDKINWILNWIKPGTNIDSLENKLGFVLFYLFQTFN